MLPLDNLNQARSYPLYNHQIEALKKIMAHGGSLAIFHEPGLGKSRTALELYTKLRKETPTLKMLVVCPLSLVSAVWQVETETYTPFKWCALKCYDRVADVFVINYESITRSSGHRLLQESGLLTYPILLCLDESSRLKDPRSLTTKTMLALAERCQHRLVMSGTPAPNSLSELWAQIKVIAPESVHRSFHAWRRTYFYLGRNGRTIAEPPPSRQGMADLFKQGFKWCITPENQTRLLEQIAPHCSWVRKADALQLPERITTIRHVTLGANEQKAYNLMRQQLVVEFEKEVVTADLALVKLQKLQQIANGFLYGETTHRIGTSRLHVLLETLEELGDQKIIIWALYQESIEQIAQVLGEKAVTLYAKTKDRNESLRRFSNEAQYLIAHPLSAGHGLTLTQSSTMIWFGVPWSLEQYSQANDRIHRIGAKHTCIYIHLLAPHTIDDDIWAVLQKKKTLQEVMDAYFHLKHKNDRSRPPSSNRTAAPVLVPTNLDLSSIRSV